MYEALLLASCGLFVVTCAAYVRADQARFVHPATFYLAFHGLAFVVRPLLAHWYQFEFIYRLYEFEPSMADKVTAILGANLAMLVFVGVACAICRKQDGLGQSDTREAWGARLFQPIMWTCVVIAPFAVWSQLAHWDQRAELYGGMVRDAATGALINTAQSGWFTDMGLMMAPLAVLLVWAARYRWWGWPFFAVFAVLQAGTGTRGPLIYAGLALAILYLLEKRRKWPGWQPLLALTLLGGVFGQILTDRGDSIRQQFGASPSSEQTASDQLKPLEGMDFANLEYLEFVIHAVPQRTGGYDYFTSNLQILTEPIPRALWPDKPIGSPVQFFSLWDYGQPIGITLSVPGAGWMALGWIGIVLQAALFALLYGTLYRSLVLRGGSAPQLLAYALLAATAVVVLRDGMLLSFARVLPFYLGPLLLVLAFSRLRSGPTAPNKPTGEAQPAPSPAERRRALAAGAVPANP